MIIICPKCGFRRDVPDDRIPPNAAVATCPHCRNRFYFTERKDGPEAVPVAAAGAEQGSAAYGTPSAVEGASRSPAAGTPADASVGSGAAARGDTLAAQEKIQRDSSALASGKTGTAASGGNPSAPPASGNAPQQTSGTDSGTAASAGMGSPSPAGDDDPLPQGARVPDMTDNAMLTGVQGRQGKAGTPAGETSPVQGNAAPAPEQPAAPEESPEELGTPWDMAPQHMGGIAAFYQTCLRVMFAAPYFFSRLHPAAPQGKALSFYLVVSVLQVLLERFWGQALASFLLSNGADDPQLRQLAGMLAPADNVVLTLLMRCAVLTMQLYVMSGIFYVLLRFVAPEKQQFSLVFQVVAYAAAPELLCIVPLLGSAVGMVWSVACGVVGLRYALRLNWIQAFSVVLPMYVLLLPVILQIAAGMAAL